jgi:hypothetical protein
VPFFKICHFDEKLHPFPQQLPAPFPPATSGIPAGKPRKNLQYRNLGKVKTSLHGRQFAKPPTALYVA